MDRVRSFSPSRPDSEVRRGLIRGFILAGVIIGLATVALSLWISNRSLRTQINDVSASRGGTSYGPVWDPFFSADELTLLVISNPPVYRFSNKVDPEAVIKRSVRLAPEQAQDLAETLKDKFVMKQNRVPTLVLSPEDYTGMGEAIGLYRLTSLFTTVGKTLVLKQSRTASAEDLKNHNVILLGSVWANEWSGKLPVKEDFVHSGNATIENQNPLPGEERQYRPEFDQNSGELLADYALVTVKPNMSFEDVVMVLAGVHSEGTEAAVEYVTAKNYLNDLNQRLHSVGGTNGPLKYYQALLKVGVENGIPTTISVISLHELSAVRD